MFVQEILHCLQVIGGDDSEESPGDDRGFVQPILAYLAEDEGDSE